MLRFPKLYALTNPKAVALNHATGQRDLSSRQAKRGSAPTTPTFQQKARQSVSSRKIIDRYAQRRLDDRKRP
jgi:hypothetical protein